MARIWLAQDDPDVRGQLTRALRRAGHDVELRPDEDAVLEAVESDVGAPDLLVLDLDLPGVGGLELCHRLRDAGVGLPVMLLTARGEELDLVAGLDAGADACVRLPFRHAELLARVHALLRRAGVRRAEADDRRVPAPGADGRPTATSGGVPDAAALRVDSDARRVWVDGTEVALTVKEFDLLDLLVRHEGRVVSRHDLVEAVWQRDWTGSAKTLDMILSTLRRKLGEDARHPRHLVTVRGQGVRYDGAVPDEAGGTGGPGAA